jgi:biopolymer transport protein ExbB
MKMKVIFILGSFLVSPVMLQAEVQTQDNESGFEKASKSVQKQLEESVAELNKLREQEAAEKVPLSKKLDDLESELVKVRLEYQQTSRLLDSRTLDLSNLRSEIKSRHEEATYLSNLLSEYIRNFESRLHIAEIQRYNEKIEAAKLAPENSNLSEKEIYKAQAGLLETALGRLEDALDGTTFDGTASDSSGSIHHGTFVLLGPAAIFQSDDGKNVGTAEQRLGSLAPSIIAFGNPEDANAAANVVSNSAGLFPLDPTLGNAHKIESTKETIVEHIKKGGPVMMPILGLAGAAFLVAIYKWLTMAFLRKPSRKRITALLNAVAQHNEKAALEGAQAIRGPVGKMLVIGVRHIREPRELIEEVMFEEVQATRLRLNRLLPFVALSASSAPLLGLLGTVTGIITTFKLITVYGSGDVKTLSSGISEALITTEYGLYVAIPSLLIYAFLSRRARGVIDQMEKAAVSFVNQVSKTPYRQDDAGGDLLAKLTSKQVEDFLQNVGSVQQPVNPETTKRYPDNSAGAIMNPRVFSVSKNATVAEAVGMIRAAGISEDIDAVFIVDEQGRFAGRVLVHHLLTRPEQTLVESLTSKESPFVRVDTHRDDVRNLFIRHDLGTIPVLDNNDKLVGRIIRNGEGAEK